MRSTSTVAAAAVLSALPAALAWGAAGHEIVATIAQIHLHPTVLYEVCSILYPEAELSTQDGQPPCHLSRVATWADQVRMNPKYRYTASMHYVGAVDDHPSQTCAFPGERGWAGHTDVNVLGAVRNMTTILEDYTLGTVDPSQAEEAMKFLIHYLGDMHMPLHLTGRERGGNGAKVTFDGRMTNLHSVWDGFLIAQALRTIPENYTQALPAGKSTIDIESHLRGTIYDPYVRRLMYEGFGTDLILGRFSSEYTDWLACPPLERPSTWDTFQEILGFQRVKDETKWDDDALCPYSWAKELHKLNCEFPVWPRELDQPPYSHAAYSTSDEHEEHTHDEEAYLDASNPLGRRPQPHPDLFELDTPEYAGRIRSQWIVERLLAMAGIRLAALLNGLFLDVESFNSTTESTPVVLSL
ncbi:phospholipase C/P1 nuclease domain-containing protein [Cristinia sonorae]|uniref:Phospholipase C/P1 nuclease domain-containing protein n=1 Tax=Cristinia sonorae TaxID=1940300 RepID=A0A8K0UQM6_9AGAR|nr:phospholipase C/P1 nuclease domain-containing protein [Cristinia sonorae]